MVGEALKRMCVSMAKQTQVVDTAKVIQMCHFVQSISKDY